MLSRRTLAQSTFALAASSLVLTGCTPPQQVTSGGTPGTSAAPSGDALVVYSNSVSEGRGEWLTAQAKSVGIALQYVDLGGGDVQNRLLAEKNNPIADVTFGLNNVYFERLKVAGIIDAYQPTWSADVDAELGDGSMFWPIVREPIMLVYNKASYPAPADAPSDWPDLWTEPQFAGKYEVPTGLGGATTQMVLSGILTRYKDATGELGISAAGWSAVEQFFKKGTPAVKGQDLYARMKAGEVNAGQMWLAGKAAREKQYGIATEAVKPAVGVPFAVQHIALVKGTKKAEAAKKFIDWFGSADVQAAWSKQFFTAPTNAQALPKGDVDAVTFTDSFTRQEIDWSFVATNLDKWIEKIQLQYLG